MKDRLTFLLAMSAFVLAAYGTDYSTWVHQIKSDTNSSPASTSGYAFGGGTFWSDGKKPEAGKSYYVPPTVTNTSPSKSQSNPLYAFAGDALAVAGVFKMASGAKKNVFYRELHFLDGALGLWESIGSLTGCVKVVSSDASPSIIRYVYVPNDPKNYTVNILSDFTGEEGSCVRFERMLQTSNVNLEWGLKGDWSDFYGTLLVADTMPTDFSTLDSLDFPGYLGAADGYAFEIGGRTCTNYAAHAGGTLSVSAASGEFETGKLKLKAGGTLSLAYADGATAVLKPARLEVEPGAKLHLDGFAVSDIGNGGEPPLIPVFRFDSLEDIPDLSGLGVLPTVAGPLPHFYLTNVVNGAGSADVCVSWKEIVVKTVRNGSGESSFTEGNEEHWSDKAMPHPGKDYLCTNNTTFLESTDLDFKGDSIAFGGAFGGSHLYFKGGTMTVADLHLLPDLIVDVYAGARTKIISGGTVTVWPGDVDPMFRMFQDRTLRVESELVGVGGIDVRNKTFEAAPVGTFIPAALNTNFNGRILFRTLPQPATETDPMVPDPDGDICMKMQISDARNLGGEFTADEDTFSAITVKGQSLVMLTDSVTFSEPTRGLFVDGAGRFDVPAEKTLAFKNTLTLGGEMWKEGEGELLLDGTVQFYAGEVLSDPVPGTNVVRVKAGSLRPGAPEATDGVSFIFSEGARLTVDASEDASGYGLYLNKTGSSLTAESASVKIPVSVADVPSGARSFSCALVTVASAADAEAAAAKLSVRRPSGFGSAKLSRRENADGSVTVMAAFSAPGFSITVR